MVSDVTVGIITHPPRIANGMFSRALESVHRQTRMPDTIAIRNDTAGIGAPGMRSRLVRDVRTRWLAWLDSDDEFLPDHLAGLLDFAEATGADYVYPWFTVMGGTDPWPELFGKPWSNDAPRQTTTTILVRTELAQEVGYGLGVDPEGTGGTGEDWAFTMGCMAAGAKIAHLPLRTWIWHHHDANTGGRPDRW